MRRQALGVQKHGIDRLRTKGGASPQALYDLVNARLDTAGGIGPRHGLDAPTVLPAGTVGLYAHKGTLQTFSSAPVGAMPAGYENNVLRHPLGTATTLAKIHYVHPLLGRLYVVAEFANGDVYDYWLQKPSAWAASTVYTYKKQVQPIAANGFVYEVTNASVLPAWSKDATHALNDEVLPTVANGFKYKAIAVSGSPARSNNAEPVWPTTEGGTVTEYRSG